MSATVTKGRIEGILYGANNLFNTQKFGNQSPYVEFVIGEDKWTSSSMNCDMYNI